MAAYAEGLGVLKGANAGKRESEVDAETTPLRNPEHYQYDFNVADISEVWRRGSVIASWLLDLTASALTTDPQLANFAGRVSDSGEGRWTIKAAIDEGVPVPALTAALYERFSSRGEADYADRVLSAMRFGFGGHLEKQQAKALEYMSVSATHATANKEREVSSPRTPATIRLLLADVDGTLVTHEKVLTQRARAAVAKMRSAGIQFAITSGRPPRGMEMLIAPLALTTPIAAFNGGMFVKPDLSVIEQRVLQADVIEPAMETMRKHGLDCWIYRGTEWFVRDRHGPHVDREEWTVKFPPTVVSNFEGLTNDVAKLVGVSDDLEAVQRM